MVFLKRVGCHKHTPWKNTIKFFPKGYTVFLPLNQNLKRGDVGRQEKYFFFKKNYKLGGVVHFRGSGLW